jgi:methionyl aminopeptidase
MAIKTLTEIERMRDAGRIVAGALREAERILSPGLSTQELDEAMRDYVLQRGGKLLFYKYEGFPGNTCISINAEVVHGIPSRRRKLRAGDLVSIDVGVKYRGFCADGAWTYPVGDVSPEAARLMAVGKESLDRGIEACRAMYRLSDIGRAIQTFVEGEGYHVVKTFVGHGIGKELHEDPQVPNYVDESVMKNDRVLKPGLTLAIEPMVNVGTEEVVKLDDGWTIVTADRKLSVHYEHTVAVTVDGPWVLTAFEL